MTAVISNMLWMAVGAMVLSITLTACGIAWLVYKLTKIK